MTSPGSGSDSKGSEFCRIPLPLPARLARRPRAKADPCLTELSTVCHERRVVVLPQLSVAEPVADPDCRAPPALG